MEVYLKLPQLKFNEKSAFTATASFRDGESSNAPTTAKYRIDCITTGKEVKDWTTLSAAASINISITPTDNTIQDSSNRYEKKQLTVAADPDTTSQVYGSMTYQVENLRGF